MMRQLSKQGGGQRGAAEGGVAVRDGDAALLRPADCGVRRPIAEMSRDADQGWVPKGGCEDLTAASRRSRRMRWRVPSWLDAPPLAAWANNRWRSRTTRRQAANDAASWNMPSGRRTQCGPFCRGRQGFSFEIGAVPGRANPPSTDENGSSCGVTSSLGNRQVKGEIECGGSAWHL
jgi:hypothetical protein